MKMLPWEVLEDIFFLACTDDGSTARALSGVSHAVRDSTAPIRFRTIALRGAHQINLFLAFLDWLDHSAPQAVSKTWTFQKKKSKSQSLALAPPVVRVRHLFVADCAEEHEGKLPAWTDWQDYFSVHHPPIKDAIARFFKSRSTAHSTCSTAGWVARNAVDRLLARLSPTLTHLCYSKSLAGDHGPFSVFLPALVELTCRFPLSDPWWTSYKLDELHRTRDLPALKRLHLVLGRVDHDQTRHLRNAQLSRLELPPSLTHFRHSEVEDIGCLLECFARYAIERSLPRGLDTILIAPKVQAPPSWPVKGAPLSQEIRSLRASHEATTSRRDVLGLVRLVWEDRQYDVTRLHKEWLDRVQGGDGCWTGDTRSVPSRGQLRLY
jgi:hypothetical protein